jgi:uncharacterized cupredoxin-like copper-binding protein
MRAVFASIAVLIASAGLAAAGPGAAGHSHSHEGETDFGRPGDPKKKSRTVELIMREGSGTMEYVPSRIEVRQGEQIRFVMKNHGELEHEFVLATFEENAKHAEEMAKNPEMEHDEPNMKRLKPKAGTDVVWHFTKAGEFQFACLIPGHMEAGMKGIVVVKPAKTSPAAAATTSKTKKQ